MIHTISLKLLSRQIYIPMISPDTFLTQFFRDCFLFFHQPIEFLITYLESLEKVSNVKEANEAAHNHGLKVMEELKNHESGGMKIYFVGSNFFKIPGINDDIDLLVEYATKDEKEKWKKILVKKFGNPILEKHKFTKWEFTDNGFHVEVLLSHPKFQIFKDLYDAYTALAHPEIRTEYIELKQNSVGVTKREYSRRQMYFFTYYVRNKLLRKS